MIDPMNLKSDNLWFTSDLHFGHTNIIKYCNRPYRDAEHMNSELIKNFNSILDEGSILINLGDVTMNERYLWAIGAIPGHHILIPGNHDAIWPAHKRANKPNVWQKYDQVFESIWFTEMVLIIDGVPFIASHLPYVGDAYGEDKHTAYRPKDEGLPLICGHVHDNWKYLDRQFNVGVDVNNYEPVPAQEVLRWAANFA